MTAGVDQLLYVAHTSPAVREQALYSVLSALAHPGGRPLAIQVVTDAPEDFSPVAPAVELRVVTADRVASWTGPAGYKHRVKPVAIGDLAGRAPGSKILFVDADTVFTGPPAIVFDRIGPRAAVMHEREYNVGTSDLAVMHRFRRRMRRARFRGEPPALHWDMWNSGAVGLHPDLLPLVGEWLAYLDAVYPVARRWVLEQYALASVLQGRGVAISEAADVVVHYWFDKATWSAALRPALERARRLPLPDALEVVRANPLPDRRRPARYGKPANAFQRWFGW